MHDALDTIVLARRVVSMTGRDAAALAIAGGRIAALGSHAEMLARRDPRTAVVHLDDAVVLPGLIEPHTHPDLCAQCYSWVDVSGFTHATAAGVERALREAIAGAPAGQWIFAFGLDFMLTPDLGVWDRARLDALAPRHPIFILIQSMHSAFVNSAALHAAGIDESTPDPEVGGRYGRDATGRLTGKVEEAGAMLPLLAAFDYAPAAFSARIRQQFQRYRGAGITTIGMPGMFVPAPFLDIYEGLTADAPLRTVAYLRDEQVDHAGRRPGEGAARFRVAGVKLWYDGSPYSGTMLLDDPYVDSELCCCRLGIARGSAGYALHDRTTLVPRLRRWLADGWQVLTHAQGDRAIREVLDMYEQVLGAPGGGAEPRWRIEHAGLISADDIARAARLGVALSFHVNHVRYYGPELRDAILGPARAERMMPIGTAVRAGHRVSLHADSPMYPPGPLGLVRTAVTRRTRTGERLGVHEAISVEQALRAVTIDAAWQLGLEAEVGSLAPGKRADLTILDADPRDVAPEQIDRIAVRATWLDGQPTT